MNQPNEHPHHVNDGNHAPSDERNADPGASTIDTLVSKYEHHAERDNDGAICNADVGSGTRICSPTPDGGELWWYPHRSEAVEQEAFEKWAHRNNLNLKRGPNGSYFHWITKLAWNAWQARAALEGKL